MQVNTKRAQVRDYLLKLVYEHLDDINYKIPSENMLCRLFKVSRITAKNAIDDLVAQGLLFRHQGKGTFISSEAKAHVLQREEIRSSELIGLLLPDLKSNFMLNIIRGVEERLHNTGFDLIIKCTNYSQTQEQHAIQTLLKSGVKGLIVYPVDRQFYNQEFLKLILDQFPLVLIDRTLQGLNVSIVTSDHVNDMKQATEFLIESGHRRIGIISTSPDGTNTIAERIQGYESALTEHRISIKGTFKLTSLVNYDEDWERKITDYFAENRQITAVITLNSDLCYKTLRVLDKLKIGVPEQISLISYADDYSDIADLLKVRLTSICQNTAEIGKRAAGVVLDQISGIDTRVKRVQIPSVFVKRESTYPLT